MIIHVVWYDGGVMWCCSCSVEFKCDVVRRAVLLWSDGVALQYYSDVVVCFCSTALSISV